MNRQLGCAGADRSFGPVVPSSCRGGFDFTLLFEQIFFSFLPAAALLLAASSRLWQLRRAQAVASGPVLQLSKQVGQVARADLPNKGSAPESFSNSNEQPTIVCCLLSRDRSAGHPRPLEHTIGHVQDQPLGGIRSSVLCRVVAGMPVVVPRGKAVSQAVPRSQPLPFWLEPLRRGPGADALACCVV